MKFFAAVIGSGPGGIKAAKVLSKKGSIALIGKELGGECLHHGCIPTKTLLTSSEFLLKSKKIGLLGLEGGFSLNFQRLIQRKKHIVEILEKALRTSLKLHKIEFIEGYGSIVSDHEVEIGSDIIECEYIVIATGSTPNVLPGIDFTENILNNRTIFNIKEVPKKLAMIGAGASGVEFAEAFHEFGSEVSVFEYTQALVPQEDEEISAELRKIFERRGIKLYLGTKISSIEDNGGFVLIEFENNKLEFDKVLICAGRKPNFNEEELTKIGIHFDKKKIFTNEFMQTNIKNIYAIGDVAGKSLLAYTAEYEGFIAAMHIIGKSVKGIDYKHVPSAIFTHPEIASIGEKEKDLKEKNIDCIKRKINFAVNPRELITDQRDGFLKLLFDAKTKKLLGAHMIGEKASELISIFTLALNQGLGLMDLQNLIIPHPVTAEILKEALQNTFDL